MGQCCSSVRRHHAYTPVPDQAITHPASTSLAVSHSTTNSPSNTVSPLESTPTSGHTSPMLIYKPLPTKTSIRLLNLTEVLKSSSLSPSTPSIDTTLQTCDLNGKPKFKALSYTWGQPYREIYGNDIESPSEFVAEITCDGKQMAVTQNLYDALVSFQKAGITGLIWIDAICINQRDNDEKSVQILMMGDIYSKAQEVIVWLGPYREGIDDLVWATEDLLPAILDAPDFYQAQAIKEGFGAGNLNHPEFWTQRGIEYPLERFIRLAYFYQACRWFKRAWVVQEVMLAKHAQLVCGEQTVSFVKANILFTLLLLFNWAEDVSLVIKHRDKPGFRWAKELAILNREILIQSSQSRGGLWEQRIGPFWTLARLTVLCKEFLCLHRRDKVYSLLGIVSNLHPEINMADYIKPDYNIGIDSLFTSVTILVLENTKDLDYIAESATRGRATGLPSWAIDYSSNRFLSFLSAVNPSLNAALCGTLSYPGFQATDRTITLYGAKFQTIETIQESTLEEALVPSFDALISFYQFYIGLPRHINARRRLEVLWRTMTANFNEDTEQSLLPEDKSGALSWMKLELLVLGSLNFSPELEAFENIIQNLEHNDCPDEMAIVDELRQNNLIGNGAITFKSDLWSIHSDSFRDKSIEYAKRISRRTNFRRLFKTESGLLGMGTVTVQPGDHVWMLCDAHTPYVLRPTDDPLSFTIVGDCYIHDFMNGEMLEDKWGVRQNIGPIKLL